MLVFDAEQVLERVERDGDLFGEALSVTQELPICEALGGPA